MANSSFSLVDLDFGQVKQNLRNYLQAQDQFKDFNFEGSNMSVLLDVLAYNTFQNAFYLNMIGSEMFLDTAQYEASILSHAKELNYLPRSFSSARAVIDVTVTPNNPLIETVEIPKGTTFVSRVGANSYTFVTDTSIILANSVNGVFTANNISVYEGAYGSESFVYSKVANNTFTLSNKAIDLSSLTVLTFSDSGANTQIWTRQNDLIDVDENTFAYFIQPAGVNLYEIRFGDGVFGRVPDVGAAVAIEYRVCSGELPNGARQFAPGGPIDGHGNVSIRTVSAAVGGRVNESIENIRFYAPRQFQTQERAVTANDYEILLKREFPEISAISAYGGEDATPPQYGKVFISIDLANADGIPSFKKRQFFDWVKPRSPITLEPVFIDPEFTFLQVEAQVKYNLQITQLSISDISSRVFGTIQTYNEANLKDFKTTIRHSRLQGLIDDTHESIVSSELEIRPYKRFQPILNADNDFIFSFDAPLRTDIPKAGTTHREEQLHVISSSSFIFGGRPCNLEDDGNGNIRIVSTEGDTHSEVATVGTVNYNTGDILISGFAPSDYEGNFLKIYCLPKEKDYSVTKNTILEIKNEDIFVSTSGIRV